MPVTHRSLTIEWLGYATLRLQTPETTVYLDPGRYGVLTGDWEPESERARTHHPPSTNQQPQDGDLICVTHVHHYDADAIERVAHTDATVIFFEGINPRDSSRELPRPVDLPYDIRRVGMESDILAKEIPIWTVPAYNERDGYHTRSDGTPYHQKGLGCGYLLSLDGITVFWPGDTDVLPGHEELDVDVFCPPIGGAFTMNRTEAASLAEDLSPDVVVPIHYNTFDAIETDSEAFAVDVASAGVPVALDEGE